MSIPNSAEGLSGSIDPPEGDGATASASSEAGLSGGEVSPNLDGEPASSASSAAEQPDVVAMHPADPGHPTNNESYLGSF